MCCRNLLQHLKRCFLHVELIGVVLRETTNSKFVVELDMSSSRLVISEDGLEQG